MTTAFDVESTGFDFYHSCRPFIVTICRDGEEPNFWEWEVNPLTRMPIIPDEDKNAIKDLVENADEIVGQNMKFDVAAIRTIIPDIKWPWDRAQDTLIAGHLLASNQPHDLTALVALWLGKDISPFEDATEHATVEARAWVKKKRRGWLISRKGMDILPSAKEKTWKTDLWVPRAVAKELEYPPNHSWWTVTSDYANVDSASTLLLWQRMRKEIERRGLWKIYRSRMLLPPIAHRMEFRGVTNSGERQCEQEKEFLEEIETSKAICMNIAEDMSYDLKMPKGAMNNSLKEFCFGKEYLNLPVVGLTDSGAPSLDKNAMEAYSHTLPAQSKQRTFVNNVSLNRKAGKALEALTSYRSFRVPWISVDVDPVTMAGWYVLHPSLNPTGTDTLRWSSNNPNSQNASKKELYNVRYSLGPAPGREWWSLDYENLELRIPAYKAGEQAMIDLFEKPDTPPYFGSNHLLACHILHEKLFNECVNQEGGFVDGRIFKNRYKSTWYSYTKNGNFAVQYGAVESSGTADRAYHVQGAQRKIQKRLGKINDLTRSTIAFAEKHGYIETLPDKTVDPLRGYPLLCTRTERGGILPTVPLSYLVQGTACWIAGKAMIRCQNQLDEWREQDGFDGHMTLYVHDELVFDFPKSKRYPREDKGKENTFRTTGSSNLWRIKVMERLMCQSGDDVGIPLRVDVTYNEVCWSKGEKI